MKAMIQWKKKAVLTMASIMCASVLGGAGLCSFEAEAKAITEDAAKKAAYADAGVKESDVLRVKARLETDDGVQKYDVEFNTAGAEYNYDISAADGKVLEKEIEQYKPAQKKKKAGGGYISVAKAKEAALKHAGMSAAAVTFSKAKMAKDDGKVKYEIEFYDSENEYEYEIDARTGKVLDSSVESVFDD